MNQGKAEVISQVTRGQAVVAASAMSAVEEAGTECSGVIESGHQTHCQGSGLYVESTGTL